MDFFVYVDRTLDGRPFYVGKGNAGRVRLSQRNKLHTNIAAKHGLQRSVVFVTAIEHEALDHERMLIAEHKTQHGVEGHWGANLTAGGEGLSNPSPVVRQKMSESQRNRDPVSATSRQRMSEAVKRWCAVPKNRLRKSEAMKNVVRSPEHRMNIARAKCKVVLQLDETGEVIATFPSAIDAQKHTGVSRSKICECCKGKRTKAGGFGWRHAG